MPASKSIPSGFEFSLLLLKNYVDIGLGDVLFRLPLLLAIVCTNGNANGSK